MAGAHPGRRADRAQRGTPCRPLVATMGGDGNERVDMEVSDMVAAWHGGGPGPWFLVFPLFWLAVIVTLAFLFRRRRWGHWHGGSGQDVLGERYARGEITEEEYRRRKAVLSEQAR